MFFDQEKRILIDEIILVVLSWKKYVLSRGVQRNLVHLLIFLAVLSYHEINTMALKLFEINMAFF